MNMVEARLWFYSRDVGSSSSCLGSVVGAPNALKHWAVVIDFMSTKTPNRVNKRVLYEANDDEGFLVAREVAHGEDEEENWMKSAGFSKEDHGMRSISEDKAKVFIKTFNDQNLRYVATSNNCQRFVDEFLAEVAIDSSVSLPWTVKEVKPWFSGASSLVVNSISNAGSAAIIKELLIKSRIGAGTTLDMVFKETIKTIDLHGLGMISILKESPIKEYMVKEGKKLVLTAFGEVTENLLNAGRGAFSWLNLLQIPVEIFVGWLMKSQKFTDLEAYAGKKLASCVTAAAVGGCVAGPFGALGSVAFWIASEVVATLTKCLFTAIFGERFTSIFGESETVNLITNIYDFFAKKCARMTKAGIDWMLEFMNSTQNKQKKLA